MTFHAKPQFKAFLLFNQGDPEHLKGLNADSKADNIALCITKGKDDEAITGYKINLDSSVKNTVLIYRNRKVTGKFVNWTPKDTAKLQTAIDAACAMP